MAGTRQVALTLIAGIAGLARVLGGRADVEDDEARLAEPALELVERDVAQRSTR
jgi:hypothetical protein